MARAWARRPRSPGAVGDSQLVAKPSRRSAPNRDIMAPSRPASAVPAAEPANLFGGKACWRPGWRPWRGDARSTPPDVSNGHAGLLAQDLDDHPLPALAVPFPIEDPLPGAEVEFPRRHRDDHLVAHR